MGLSAAWLAACTSNATTSTGLDVGAARPDNPVTLPISSDNEPIPDDLAPETDATLRIFNWAEYIRPRVVKGFADSYDTRVQVTTFSNMDEALEVLRRGAAFDVLFLRVDVLGRLVQQGLLRPLNHSYIPNLEANVWPVYRNPFYDQSWRYTVPYTVYTTGIAWRVDHVDTDIPSMDNPYDIFWDERYAGKINLFDDYREVVGMALLRNGVTDLNTSDRDVLEHAERDLVQLAGLVNRLDIDAYANIPRGDAWIHQAYSGDMVAAPYYFPKGEDPSVVRYWVPPDGGGAVGNDAIALLSGGRNPVLGHLFINYLLDFEISLDNYAWNGYQPPLRRLKADALVEAGYVPPYLQSVLVQRRNFNRGFMQLELDRRTDRLWHRAYGALAQAVEEPQG
jgi:spermidine/putrescine transport system substrate-binding protein